MKKFILFLALLLVGGVANATNIISSLEPKEGGPEYWVTSVYNNAGSTLNAGDVVIWDKGSSTGDNDNWVTTTTTAETAIVAGVVFPKEIAAGSNGTIAVYGVVDVNTTGGVVNNGPVCTSTNAGKATTCTGTNPWAVAFGVGTANGTGSTVPVHLRLR